MTYENIITAMRGISNSSIMSKKIPMKIKLPILYNINKFSDLLTGWNAAYHELIDRYAKKDNAGKPIVINDNYEIPNESLSDYSKEFNDMMTAKVISKEELQTIPMEYFDKYDEEKFDVLTLQEIQAIRFMLDTN